MDEDDSLFLSRVICLAICTSISQEEIEEVLTILPPRPKIYLAVLYNLAYKFSFEGHDSELYKKYYNTLYKWDKDESNDWCFFYADDAVVKPITDWIDG